ncbi:MAG: type I glyceraldehyde-3-phosphate dehydrogenase [Deltaproteobacteria bacterium]|nr:type I glyceraldehyde-3-phosphate dehydrogenase [Deltaproteobacteria bacterium]
MALRVAINGFGRIGRCVFRSAWRDPEVEIVHINDLTSPFQLAHLLKHDSVHGNWSRDVSSTEDGIVIDGKEIKVSAEKEPQKLPWKALGIDVVLECTGAFTKREKAAWHLDAGADRVIISAPAEGEDITVCLGVNDHMLDLSKHRVISNASCTTNCLAPFAKVLHQEFGIVQGLMTTIHSYTMDQNLLDAPHKKADMRRARAAALSMVPTSTGAAKAVGLVLPELKGKLNGLAIRVPTPNVSVVDLVFNTERPVSKDGINAALSAAAAGPMKGILAAVKAPLVSLDLNGNPHSSIVDLELTAVMGDRMAKVLSWYDNEWGFSNRMVDLCRKIARS